MSHAAVMYIAERESIDTVFTLDRRDFSRYRTTDGLALSMDPKPYAALDQKRSMSHRDHH